MGVQQMPAGKMCTVSGDMELVKEHIIWCFFHWCWELAGSRHPRYRKGPRLEFVGSWFCHEDAEGGSESDGSDAVWVRGQEG